MKYRVNHPSQDVALALGLDAAQQKRINNAIQKAYETLSGKDFSVDELNGLVAPYLKTTEEGFFAALIMTTDVLSASFEQGIKPEMPPRPAKPFVN